MKRSLIALAAFAFSSCAFADSSAFIATGNNHFGITDLNTGAYTDLGLLGGNLFSIGFTPAGLGEIGNTIYTASFLQRTLYAVDTHTGNVTTIGSGNNSFAYFVLGSTNSGLYSMDQSGALYSINPTTGATTLLGSTGINVGSNFTGISTGANILYVTVGNTLYSINPSVSTAATAIGTVGIGGMGALVAEHGSLFGTSLVNPNATYNVNWTTGNTVLLGLLQAPDYAYGLAPDVPEPSTFGLLGLASLLGVGYFMRRRRQVAVAA